MVRNAKATMRFLLRVKMPETGRWDWLSSRRHNGFVMPIGSEFCVVGNSLRRALELEKRRREEAARDKKHLEPTQKSSGY